VEYFNLFGSHSRSSFFFVYIYDLYCFPGANRLLQTEVTSHQCPTYQENSRSKSQEEKKGMLYLSAVYLKSQSKL
jgi:hypothetical protein